MNNTEYTGEYVTVKILEPSLVEFVRKQPIRQWHTHVGPESEEVIFPYAKYLDVDGKEKFGLIAEDITTAQAVYFKGVPNIWVGDEVPPARVSINPEVFNHFVNGSNEYEKGKFNPNNLPTDQNALLEGIKLMTEALGGKIAPSGDAPRQVRPLVTRQEIQAAGLDETGRDELVAILTSNGQQFDASGRGWQQKLYSEVSKLATNNSDINNQVFTVLDDNLLRLELAELDKVETEAEELKRLEADLEKLEEAPVVKVAVEEAAVVIAPIDATKSE